ncbi:hypothetical protein EMIT0158MI4_40497 [Burkholderia ambifaria]
MRSDEEDCEVFRVRDDVSMRRAPQPQPRTLNRSRVQLSAGGCPPVGKAAGKTAGEAVG